MTIPEVKIQHSTTEEAVDELYNLYLSNVLYVKHYDGADEAMITFGKEEAREKLFEEIRKRPDCERALRLVEAKFNQDKTPSVTELVNRETKGEQQPEASSVQYIPTTTPPPLGSYGNVAEQGLVPLFDITEERETVFHREILDSLCAQIGERSVAIISTAGKFRQGKTFWSNVLLDGLRKDQADEHIIFQYEDDEHIGGQGGIRFQSGYERHTRGIMVWPKVFDRKDKEGKDLAVILMDTQGTFDTSSNIADGAIIFAISLLMSSIKIFNTMRQIDAQDLDALNMFIAFSQRTEERVGQHFILLMRDALETGLQPGHINSLRSGTHRAPELLRLMDGVFDAFENVECYMVPRPSEHVLRASGEIRAGDCGSDFLMGLCGAANHVLKNLVAKKVMGTELTGSTLKQYVENLIKHIRDNQHKAIGSAFAATSQLYFEKARSASNETFAKLYQQLVHKHNHRPIKPSEYNEAIQHIVEETFKEYQTHPLFGSTELKAKEFKSFQGSLLHRCHEKEENNRQRYRDVQMADAVNGSYEIYEKEIEPDLETRLGIREKKINYVNERHANALPMAMDNFENAVSDFQNELNLIEDKRNLLNEMIQARYEHLQEDNAIRHLHQQADEMFQRLVEEHWKALKERVATIKYESGIEEAIDACQNLLWGKYGSKKAEFVADVAIALPKISPKMVERLLDNFKDSRLAQFKKCEDSFEVEVGQNLKIGALKKQVEDLHEDKKGWDCSIM